MSIADATILQAIEHRAIWRPWFRDPVTWRPWRGFLSALFGLPLDAAGLATLRECTNLDDPPPGGASEVWLICGRRAGKSFILALIACFLACFRSWSAFLAPGEVGTVKVLAVDRRQARVIHRYCRALLKGVPALAAMIVSDDDDEIVLSNGLVIEIQTASFRSVRGYTVIAALCDEIAFWRSDESANPDTEILNALRPAMATVPGALLLCASSPYARRGALWNAWRKHYGRAGGPLVWRAATRTMNPTVDQAIIDEAREADPAAAAAEYDAEFRSDIETFIAREVVDAAVAEGRHELPRVSGIRYVGFVDPSGGSSDSMTLGIAHRGGDGRAVLDLVREVRPPFSPEAVVAEFAGTLKAYHCREVTGDHYAGEWPREQFKKQAIQYRPSDKNKSAIYLEALPLLNSGNAELLDIPRLISQLCGLERRTARGGKDSINHAPGAHDDVVNAVLGALTLVGDTAHQPVRISDATLDWSRLRGTAARPVAGRAFFGAGHEM